MAIIDLPDDENQASIVIMQQVQSDFECMNVVDDLPVESHHQVIKGDKVFFSVSLMY